MLRWCVVMIGSVHPFLMGFFQTGANPLARSGHANPLALLAFTAFFAWPYWVAAVTSLWVRSPTALVASSLSMLAVGTWEWCLVIASESSTKVLSLFVVPIEQFFIGATTFAAVALAAQILRRNFTREP
jgi:hypothetical protein